MKIGQDRLVLADDCDKIGNNIDNTTDSDEAQDAQHARKQALFYLPCANNEEMRRKSKPSLVGQKIRLLSLLATSTPMLCLTCLSDVAKPFSKSKCSVMLVQNMPPLAMDSSMELCLLHGRNFVLRN
jgi:hypothetical protein